MTEKLVFAARYISKDAGDRSAIFTLLKRLNIKLVHGKEAREGAVAASNDGSSLMSAVMSAKMI